MTGNLKQKLFSIVQDFFYINCLGNCYQGGNTLYLQLSKTYDVFNYVSEEPIIDSNSYNDPLLEVTINYKVKEKIIDTIEFRCVYFENLETGSGTEFKQVMDVQLELENFLEHGVSIIQDIFNVFESNNKSFHRHIA